MKKKIKILVPELPESVYQAKIIKWNKKIGDIIQKDDVLVDLETDKIIIEVPTLKTGKLISINKYPGDLVKTNDLLCYIQKNIKYSKKNYINTKDLSPSLRRKKKIFDQKENNTHTPSIKIENNTHTPSIKIENNTHTPSIKIENNTHTPSIKIENNKNLKNNFSLENNQLKIKKIIEMSSFRKKISEKLIKSKNETAMLTTFNEVNMDSIIKIRKNFGDSFQKKHKIKLGLMSFFVKSVYLALKEYPQINTSINKNKIIFYDSFNINIAISTHRGLVAPVLFNVDRMTMADIEKKINFYSIQGKNNKLTMNDLNNGTFTITNGGVFGSLFSTPIINSPQTAILGTHTIKNRPIATKKNKIKIAPMMYISLSYDHRLIDGKDSVGFLMKIKYTLENFMNIALDI
ncbi:dihydrolipoyllysine-residue succinyltransferase [Buchnera aphidicola]|uniref:dihydrolipoyllysine-residue succinyltransferase n=1 Tax=Buchnera aphidicola TaxID=9 RepID=UPI0031B8918C